MAITFVGYQTATYNAAAGADQNLSTTLVSGTIQTGDLLIVCMNGGNSGTTTCTVRDTNLSWTALTHRNQADTIDANLDVAYAFATSSTPANILFDNANAGNMGAILYVFRGVDQTTPLDGVTPTGASAASTTAANPAAITPSSADSVIVTIAAIGHAAGASATSSFTAGPSGYSNFVNLTNRTAAGSFQCSLGVAWKQSTGNTSQDPGVYTASATNAQWCYTCYTLSLRMAPASGKTVTADAGSYSITGVAAGVIRARKVAAAAGSYSMSGVVAAVKKGRTVTASVGSYAISGQAANVKKNDTVIGLSGSYTISGQVAAVKLGRRVTASAGSYTIGGQVAAVRKGSKLVAGVGTYSMSGVAAGVLHSWKVAAAAGSYTISGSDAAIVKATQKTLTADPGSYAISGQAAAVRRGLQTSAGAGSYAISGQAAAVKVSRKVAAAAGSYSISGTSAGVRRALKALANAGSYQLTGVAANVLKTRVVVGGSSSYTISGQPALTIRGRKVAADPGSYLISGTDAALSTGGPTAPPGAGIGGYGSGGDMPPVHRQRDTRWDGVREAREEARRLFDKVPATPVARRKDAAVRASEAVAKVAKAVTQPSLTKSAFDETALDRLLELQAYLQGLIDQQEAIKAAQAREAAEMWAMIERELILEAQREEELMIVMALAL